MNANDPITSIKHNLLSVNRMHADGFLGVGAGKVKADRSQSITQMISCGRQLSVSELGPIVSCY